MKKIENLCKIVCEFGLLGLANYLWKGDSNSKQGMQIANYKTICYPSRVRIAKFAIQVCTLLQ